MAGAGTWCSELVRPWGGSVSPLLQQRQRRGPGRKLGSISQLDPLGNTDPCLLSPLQLSQDVVICVPGSVGWAGSCSWCPIPRDHGSHCSPAMPFSTESDPPHEL